MLDVTHSQVDVETEFGVVSLDFVSLSILASVCILIKTEKLQFSDVLRRELYLWPFATVE